MYIKNEVMTWIESGSQLDQKGQKAFQSKTVSWFWIYDNLRVTDFFLKI
jgi:hypothetical protein